MKIQYRNPSFEDVEQLIRRGKQHEAVQKAYRGDPSQLSDLLRADGWHLVAHLIEHAKPLKRAAPAWADCYADVKQIVTTIMRTEVEYRKRIGQPFPWSEQEQYLKALLAKMTEEGDILLSDDEGKNGLTDAELEKLVKDVLFALHKGRDNRRIRPR